ERGLEPDPDLVLDVDPRRMNIVAATRYVLGIRTNIYLIAASALGYYFLAGVQTFGSEFAKEQYRIGQALANILLLVIGAGAVAGVLAGGALGDRLLKRGRLNGRLYVAIGAATLTPVLFGPALFTRSATSAVPYLMGAVLVPSAQRASTSCRRSCGGVRSRSGRCCARSRRRSRRSCSAPSATTCSAAGAAACNGR